MLWKKSQPAIDGKLILGMILLHDALPFDPEKFQKDIRKNEKLKAGKMSGDVKACTLTVNGEIVGIGSMPMPVPGEEIERIATKASYWENDMTVLRQQQGHLIVSMLPSSSDTIKRYRVFTSVVCSLL